MTVNLRLGDCLEVMRTLEAGSVDAVVTDPPYGVGLSCEWDTWPREVWAELRRVVKPSGWLVFSIAPHVAHERLGDVTAAGWKVLEVGFWVWGSGRPVANGRLKRNYDLVYFCAAAGSTLNIDDGRGAHVASSITGRKGSIRPNTGLARSLHKCDRRSPYECGQVNYWPSNVACELDSTAFGDSEYDLIFSVKRRLPVNHAAEGHPTGKPLDLIAQQVNLASWTEDVVLDPFMGSGTTGVACVQTGRNFIGIEIDPGYFAIAQRRIAEAQLQLALPLEALSVAE